MAPSSSDADPVEGDIGAPPGVGLSMTSQQWSSPPSLDTAMGVLSDRYRRQLLVALLEQESQNPVHVDDISHETGGRKTSTVEAYHSHLPKLADNGYVTWDKASGAVWPGPHFDELRPLLEFLSAHRRELPDSVR